MSAKLARRGGGTNLTTTRLALQLTRFELVGLGLVIAGGLIAAALFIAQVNAAGLTAVCARAMRGDVGPIALPPGSAPAGPPAMCEQAMMAFQEVTYSPLGSIVRMVLYAAPFILAALAGVSVVSREIERGTARLAWSLAPSRARWFVGRTVPVLVVVAALAFVDAVAMDRITSATQPGIDTANAFIEFGGRGVVLAARAVFVFAIAVLIGAWLGRALPAVLLTIVVAVFGLAGGSWAHNRILASEAIVIPGEQYNPENMTFNSGFAGPDGRFISWEVMNQIDPMPQDGTTDWVPIYPPAQLAVPGSRYRFVEARETVVLLLGGLGALVLAALQVRRARPG